MPVGKTKPADINLLVGYVLNCVAPGILEANPIAFPILAIPYDLLNKQPILSAPHWSRS